MDKPDKPKKAKSKVKKNRKSRTSEIPSTVVLVPEQSLNTIYNTPPSISEFNFNTETNRASFDVVEDVFGKMIAGKIQENNTSTRKQNLMDRLGIKEIPKAEKPINKAVSDTSFFQPRESFYSMTSEQSQPSKNVTFALDSATNKIYEVELKDVDHPTYNPPLGSYEFYKVYDRYLSLLEEFKKRERTVQYEGLTHIWQQKIKAELLNRFRWPPKIMADVFWGYGYYRDYCPLEARVNLNISKRIRKSLETLLTGHQSHQHSNSHNFHHRHRQASEFDFDQMKVKILQKLQSRVADDDWFLLHPDVSKSEKDHEHHHHHHGMQVMEHEKVKRKRSSSKGGKNKLEDITDVGQASMTSVVPERSTEDYGNEASSGRRNTAVNTVAKKKKHRKSQRISDLTKESALFTPKRESIDNLFSGPSTISNDMRHSPTYSWHSSQPTDTTLDISDIPSFKDASRKGKKKKNAKGK